MLLTALALMQAAPAQTAPVWTYKEATDANGKISATAAIRAEDGSGRLIVRCDTAAMPIVSIQYIPKPALPAMDSHQVTVTFNEANAEFSAWEFPGAGAYYGEPVSVWIMVGMIATAKTVRIQTDDASGAQIGSVFAGPGNDAMFRKVYAACGFPWQQPAVGLTQ
jgi:hypothetical protein